MGRNIAYRNDNHLWADENGAFTLREPKWFAVSNISLYPNVTALINNMTDYTFISAEDEEIADPSFDPYELAETTRKRQLGIIPKYTYNDNAFDRMATFRDNNPTARHFMVVSSITPAAWKILEDYSYEFSNPALNFKFKQDHWVFVEDESIEVLLRIAGVPVHSLAEFDEYRKNR